MTLDRVRVSAIGLVMAFTFGTLAATAPAGASITGAATLKLSGAGKGTLHEGPQAFCTTAQGQGVDLIGLVGSVSGFKKAATWSLVVASQSKAAGTYTISSGNGPSGQLDPMTKHPTEASSAAGILNATAGKYTVKGTKGSMDVTFGTGKKAITVKGSWNCSAG